jgi:hypothetical protein
VKAVEWRHSHSSRYVDQNPTNYCPKIFEYGVALHLFFSMAHTSHMIHYPVSISYVLNVLHFYSIPKYIMNNYNGVVGGPGGIGVWGKDP